MMGSYDIESSNLMGDLPSKRSAKPDEIAKAAMFQMSDISSFVTRWATLAGRGNSFDKV